MTVASVADATAVLARAVVPVNASVDAFTKSLAILAMSSGSLDQPDSDPGVLRNATVRYLSSLASAYPEESTMTRAHVVTAAAAIETLTSDSTALSDRQQLQALTLLSTWVVPA